MTMTIPEPHMGAARRAPIAGGLTGEMIGRALRDAVVKLNPVKLLKNPVIFTTWIVALLSTLSAAAAIAGGQSAGFAVQLALWLWATVLFANVAESVAEGRGKAAADSLRATRVTTKAKLIVDPKTDVVLGCHMVGEDSAEIIQGFGVAVVAGLTKNDFDRTIGIHPTSAEEFVTMRVKVPDHSA